MFGTNWVHDRTLSLNPYAWNNIANMVYIESPVGVGFSYTDDPSNLRTGDAQTALDNYNLIQAFLVRFPEFSNNSLYISSESYGGHYMPTLAKQIVDSNVKGGNPKLNFKGFAVGNPYTDSYSAQGAMLDTYWGHQLVPQPLWDSYQTKCVSTNKQQTVACLSIENQILNSVGNLNPYALDFPVCTSGSSAHKAGYAQRVWMLNNIFADRTPEERKELGIVSTEAYEPCGENYANTYLNRADVKAAIHVKSALSWGECSNTVKYNSADRSVSTAPIYQYLIDGGFKLDILVYSGDDDSVCGTIGTQSWIWGLGYTPVNPQWTPYMVDGQTAGFFTQWANTKLGFLTIHGAGHEVPTYVPRVALDMWTKYLQGHWTNK